MAAEVWRRFGDVRNYVEPFCFSAAVLLKRPGFVTGAVETINDRNLFVANFWRAVKGDPDAAHLRQRQAPGRERAVRRGAGVVPEVGWRAGREDRPVRAGGRVPGD